jgi:hypothetical protein
MDAEIETANESAFAKPSARQAANFLVDAAHQVPDRYG